MWFTGLLLTGDPAVVPVIRVVLQTPKNRPAPALASLRHCLPVLVMVLLMPKILWPAQPCNCTKLSTAEIVDRLVAQNQAKAKKLVGYTSTRRYHLEFHGVDSLSADLLVHASYRAPNHKQFTVESETGSGFLLKHVLLPLLQAETEAAQPENREKSELTPRNYTFRLLGCNLVGTRTAYVLDVTPKHANKFLFRGKIYVDDQEFALIHTQAEPAKNPSWWTVRNQIEETYSKVGDVWLPAQNTTSTKVRFFGNAVLTINYEDYQLTLANAGVSQQ